MLVLELGKSLTPVNTPVVMNEHTPPHSNAETLLSATHTPRRWISMEALTVSQTDCSTSIDDVTSDVEDRSTKQIQDCSMHSCQRRCYEIVPQRKYSLVPSELNIWTRMTSQALGEIPVWQGNCIYIAHQGRRYTFGIFLPQFPKRILVQNGE